MVNRRLIERRRLPRFRRRVIFRARRDPTANQLDLIVRKRRSAERHPGLPFAFDKCQDRAFLRSACLIDRPVAAARRERFESRQVQAALLDGRLMASLAISLENRTNFAEVAGVLRKKARGGNKTSHEHSGYRVGHLPSAEFAARRQLWRANWLRE